MPRRNMIMTGGALLLAAAAVAGCSHSGSFDVDDSPSTKWNNLVSMVEFKGTPDQPRPFDQVKCPEIVVLGGTSADRVYATKGSESNETLRYQFSVNDVARDCRVEGNQMSVKVGVAGKVLLGPAGSPGSYSAPIRVVVVREVDQSPVFSKLYHVASSIASADAAGTFTLVTEPFGIPNYENPHDYTIKVGFDTGAPGAAGKGKAKMQQANAANAAGAADEQPQPHHHHHRHANPDQAQ